MRSRKDEDMVNTFRIVYDEITAKWHKLALHAPHNECSRA